MPRLIERCLPVLAGAGAIALGALIAAALLRTPENDGAMARAALEARAAPANDGDEARGPEAIAAWEKYLEAGGEAKERVEALIAMAKAQAQGGKDGRSVYEARCAACHGLQGEGGVGPRLKGNPILKVPEAVREIVLQGRGTMPAVPLSEEELEALLGYLGSL